MAGSFDSDEIVAALKAAAEPTRLRILLLLAAGELNVKDLTQVLGQSQPRISRHLKLLAEAGLIERFREGSWVYFHVSDRTARRPACAGPSRPRRRDRSRDRARPRALRGSEARARSRYAKLLPQPRRRLGSHPRAARGGKRGRGGDGAGAWRRDPSSCSSTSAPEPDVRSSSLPTASSAVSASTSTRRCSPTPAASSRAHTLPAPRCATATSTRCRFADGVADAVVMHQVLHFLARSGAGDPRGSARAGTGRQAAHRRFRAA